MVGKERYTDWWCPKCRMTIYGSKDKCSKCHYWRPIYTLTLKNKPNKSNVFPNYNDYDCLACGHHNFGRNDKCRVCYTNRPYKNTTQHGKPGDWFCSDCGDLQFKQNSVCLKCGFVKEVPDALKDDIHENKYCRYCMSSFIDTALVHANETLHICVCFPCAQLLKKDNMKCLVCAEPIVSINKVY